MKTTVKAKGVKFRLKSEYKGDTFWHADDRNKNNHIITVATKDSEITFDFWGSVSSPKIESKEDLQEAFYSLLFDAVSGDMEENDFFSQLGYDPDSGKGISVYEMCKESLSKLQEIYTGDIYDLISDYREKYDL